MALADCRNMVFMGTAVTRGNGSAVVVATGTATEMGKISSLLAATETEPSPLEKRLEQTGRFLVVLTLAITAMVAGTGIIGGRPWVGMLKTGIALAIAAVPEGLPAVATVTLAIGMWRMARHRALVKSLPAVETLGSTTVICTDKTGTLTENQMTLQEIVLPGRHLRVEGTGYAPEGNFWEADSPIDASQEKNLLLFLRAGALCSNATLSHEKGIWSLIGDPTEGALVAAAHKAGLNRDALMQNGWQRLDELPFDSDTRFMAVRCATPKNGEAIYLKGSPDVILDMCDTMHQEDTDKTAGRSGSAITFAGELSHGRPWPAGAGTGLSSFTSRGNPERGDHHRALLSRPCGDSRPAPPRCRRGNRHGANSWYPHHHDHR